MKTLVVFYSLEGSTKLIANMIAEKLSAEILELRPEKEIPKEGFRKFFWGGKSVIFKEKPKLQNTIPDLDKYDSIFIGTPIWAGSYTPPINTFISKSYIKNKKLAFFACNSGGDADKCFDKLSNIYKDNIIKGKICFKEPIKDDKEKIKKLVNDWINILIN